MTVADTRCPRCYRAAMLRDDGTVRPHLRLSVGSRKGPKVGPSFVVWCGTSEPPARSRPSSAPTRDDGGDGGRSA